jgi:hypothetical protein
MGQGVCGGCIPRQGSQFDRRVLLSFAQEEISPGIV